MVKVIPITNTKQIEDEVIRAIPEKYQNAGRRLMELHRKFAFTETIKKMLIEEPLILTVTQEYNCSPEDANRIVRDYLEAIISPSGIGGVNTEDKRSNALRRSNHYSH